MAKKEPLYLQVKKKLLQAIDKMEPGKNKMPDENTLVEMMGVSRSTVREALNSLMLDGVVRKFPGKGIYAFPSVNRLSFRMDNYADFRNLLGVGGAVKVMSSEPTIQSPSEAMKRRMPEYANSRVYSWVRSYYLEENLGILATFEVPEENYVHQETTGEDMAFREYLRKYISKDIAYHISWIKSTRNEQLAEHFASKNPVIESWEQVFKDIHDFSICFCELSFNPDTIDLSIIVHT